MKRIVFVCLGNICRSPAAEGVMQSMVDKAGLVDAIKIDSAGTSGWHIGEKADRRMRQTADNRGYSLTSRSRQFQSPVDFETFDLIVAMDDDNVRDLKSLDRSGSFAHKIVKMTDFCQNCRETEVPDPYYGGAQGFEHVLDLLEDACAGLLEHIKKTL